MFCVSYMNSVTIDFVFILLIQLRGPLQATIESKLLGALKVCGSVENLHVASDDYSILSTSFYTMTQPYHFVSECRMYIEQ